MLVDLQVLSPGSRASSRRSVGSGSRRSVTRRASGILAQQQLLPVAVNVTLLHGRRVLFHASASTRVGDVFAFAARESGLTEDLGVFGLAYACEDGAVLTPPAFLLCRCQTHTFIQTFTYMFRPNVLFTHYRVQPHLNLTPSLCTVHSSRNGAVSSHGCEFENSIGLRRS